ncbi:restriction endonuclease fold toxin-2 domain-containing protein [Kitasatospora sp. NPDC096077]|uniref:restriction endonuclease fold toxin-2 domain-containing protein n=1 Tax=Kitasatospora sp. NPDC096077 TaxID=3155544 RepID=UPI003333752B
MLSGFGGGMDGGYKVEVKALVEGSWQMHQISQDLLSTVTLLAQELSTAGGMIGADEAGEVFAKVYKPAAKTTLDQMANTCHFVGKCAETLLVNANNYLAAEDAVAKQILEASQDTSASLSQPWTSPGQCAPDPRGIGASLPEAVGTTSGVDKWVWGDLYRGDADKLRKTASAWRSAHRLTVQVLSDAQDAWRTVGGVHDGETAKAIASFFGAFVGKQPNPQTPSDANTLLANVPSACRQLADACDNYAKYIEDCSSVFNGWFDAPWDNPIFGGNGDDGGLKKKVVADTRILSLGDTVHVLDNTQKRITVPQGQPTPSTPSGPGFPWGVPFPAPIPLPGPLPLVPAAYYPVDPNSPAKPPMGPPVPPHPGFPPLTPTELASFQQWKSGLVKGHFSGGNIEEMLYQLNTAGYPEYQLPISPLKPGMEPWVMADGLRDSDGMIVEAKYVRNPKTCYRTLDELEKSQQKLKGAKPPFLFSDDEQELYKYAKAIADPQNKNQIRGVEIDTSDPDTVSYWRTVLALRGVKGIRPLCPRERLDTRLTGLLKEKAPLWTATHSCASAPSRNPPPPSSSPLYQAPVGT